MSASLLKTRTNETSSNPNDGAETGEQSVNGIVGSLLKKLDHIGTSIALGEAGDLDAADAYRRKNLGH